MYDSDKRKLLSALCHGAIFFSTTIVSIGLPIAILFVSDDPVVKDNAKESINFHFNVWLYGAILGALFFSDWLVSFTLNHLVTTSRFRIYYPLGINYLGANWRF